MTSLKIFLRKGIPLTMELFEKISNKYGVKFSGSDIKNIKDWNRENSSYAGTIINPASNEYPFMPSYGEEGEAILTL
jgi:hypothetical protein